jgi:hypothetical protein
MNNTKINFPFRVGRWHACDNKNSRFVILNLKFFEPRRLKARSGSGDIIEPEIILT